MSLLFFGVLSCAWDKLHAIASFSFPSCCVTKRDFQFCSLSVLGTRQVPGRYMHFSKASESSITTLPTHMGGMSAFHRQSARNEARQSSLRVSPAVHTVLPMKHVDRFPLGERCPNQLAKKHIQVVVATLFHRAVVPASTSTTKSMEWNPND
jgi:hypothetical protein